MSKEIARKLKMDVRPDKSARCLSCHSLSVSPDRRGVTFKLDDGVSCGSCHGPASNWIGTHSLEDEAYRDSLKRGMKDIRNPVVQAETCLSCHLGNHAEGEVVDHVMLAAGHPPLTFEVNAFSRKLPPHWREKRPTSEDDLPRAKLWAIGQLVTLREALRLLAADGRFSRWPEVAHFECASCHVNLTSASWRQLRPNPGRPGVPQWRFSGVSAVALQIAGNNDTLRSSLETLERGLVASPFGKTDELVADADNAAVAVEQVIKQINNTPVSSDQARSWAIDLCDLAESTAWRGHAAASQIHFGLAALLSEISPSNSNIIRELDHLADELQTEGDYDPRVFIKSIQSLRAKL